MAKTLQRPISLLLAMIIIISVFTVCPVTAGAVTTTDTLDRAFTGITGTSYTAWSGKAGNSGAVYAGQSAGGNSSIQLRSNNNNSGIVTTASGGKVKKITVVWNSNTSNGRTLDIYGKNEAYTAATDLYNSSTQGTKLGSIVKGTSTELTVSGDYTYIGMRSNSGAMYLTSVSVEWASADTPDTYTVIWKNGSETLETDEDVVSGSAPEFNGTEPTKAADAQYTYTFDGWKSSIDNNVYAEAELPAVNADVIYTAHFSETVNTYTVIWANEDGSWLVMETEVPYGTIPSFNGDEPEKEETAEYRYEFAGWTPDISAVHGDITYTAVYNAVSKLETTDAIVNSDTGISGTNYGTWSEVSKPSGAVYAGQSAGGNSSIQLRSSGSTSGVITTASAGTVSKVAVTWNSNTTSGRTVDIYGKNEPYTAATDLYSSSTQGTKLGSIVCGTSTELTVSGSYAYIGIRSKSGALYLDEIRVSWMPAQTYTVIWADEDGGVFETDENVTYGSTPEFNGTYPTKESDAEHNYTFDGWKSSVDNKVYTVAELPAVTADVTYTAHFSEAVNTYTVTWNNYDGETLKTDEVAYGSTPSYDGETPVKESDGSYNYHFSGWSPEIGEVTGDITYTAVFIPVEILRYTVTWKNGSETLETDSNVEKGSYLSYDGETPEKADDGNYSYTFYGWTDGEHRYQSADISGVKVNDDLTLTALYSAEPLQLSGRILKTDDGKTYKLAGKYYQLNASSEPVMFTDELAFDDNYVDDFGELLLGDVTVAESEAPENGVFAHTVYVTGEGTQADPFIFYPNYIIGGSYSKLSDAPGTDISEIHPGDGFVSMSRPNIGSEAYARFLQYIDKEDLQSANGYLGVSSKYYGNSYSGANASPYSFVSGSTLYYVGQTDGVYNFSEEIQLSEDLGPELPTYTVTWLAYDGTELRADTVYQGVSPSYGEAPARGDDSDYSYTFAGWYDGEHTYPAGDTLPPVSGDITYTAVYDRTDLSTYTVTWLDHNADTLAERTYKKGAKPYYSGSKPATYYSEDGKTAYQFNYTWEDFDTGFSYESDRLPAVTGDTVYVALYDPINVWTISWYADDESTELASKTYLSGEVPVYPNDNPTKPADDNYTYIFSGWRDYYTGVVYPGSLPAASDNTDYIAYYTAVPIPKDEYYVMWVNYNDETLDEGNYPAGQVPTYTGETPTKPDEGDYKFVFTGWDPVPTVLTDDTIFTAQFDKVKKNPEVLWLNYDGETVLGDETYSSYDTPVYKGETPTKPADEDYTYTFTGWDPTPAPLTDDEIYTAQFEAVPIPVYTITWNNWDGTQLRTVDLKEGKTPYYNSTPTRPSDDTYRYNFIGWSDGTDFIAKDDIEGGAFPAASRDVTYTAQYEAEEIPVHTITWNNWDGSLIMTSTCKDREYPVYTGETPVRPADSEYTYTFAGWLWNGNEYAEGETLPQAITDRTFTAYYTAKAIPTPSAPRVDGIVPTNDGAVYELEWEKWCLDINGDYVLFEENGGFEETDDTLYLAGTAVAEIETGTYKELAHTVYVTGLGTYDDPYVF